MAAVSQYVKCLEPECMSSVEVIYVPQLDIRAVLHSGRCACRRNPGGAEARALSEYIDSEMLKTIPGCLADFGEELPLHAGVA